MYSCFIDKIIQAEYKHKIIKLAECLTGTSWTYRWPYFIRTFQNRVYGSYIQVESKLLPKNTRITENWENRKLTAEYAIHIEHSVLVALMLCTNESTEIRIMFQLLAATCLLSAALYWTWQYSNRTGGFYSVLLYRHTHKCTQSHLPFSEIAGKRIIWFFRLWFFFHRNFLFGSLREEFVVIFCLLYLWICPTYMCWCWCYVHILVII